MLMLVGLILMLLFIFPGNVYADLVIPPTFYLFSSFSVLLTMVGGDFIVLKLALKTLNLGVSVKKFWISLLVVFILGFLADFGAVKLTALSLASAYPADANRFTYQYNNVARISADFLRLIKPLEFYRISVYLSNYLNVDFPEYHQPFSTIMIGIWSLVLISVFNLILKGLLKLSWKQTVTLSIVLGVLTNPILPFNKWFLFGWFVVICCWYWKVKKNPPKKTR